MAKSAATLAAELETQADSIDALITELVGEGVQVVQFGSQRFDLMDVSGKQGETGDSQLFLDHWLRIGWGSACLLLLESFSRVSRTT